MVRKATLILALLAASCSPSPAERAVKEYELIRANNLANSLHPDDKCRAARRAKEAFLQEGDTEQYDIWAITEFNACSEAERGV